MARRVDIKPKTWTQTGVLYVPQVGQDGEDWAEYLELRGKAEPTEAEAARLVELKALTPEMFRVHLRPYSGNEYQDARARLLAPIEMDFKGQGKGGAPKTGAIKTDMARLHFNFACDVVRERVDQVLCYSGAELDDATGEPTGETLTPTTGAELVDFILKHMDEDEYPVIDDLFSAVKSMSHLKASLGEA